MHNTGWMNKWSPNTINFKWSHTYEATGPPGPLCFQDGNQAALSQLHHLVAGVGNGLFFLPQCWRLCFFLHHYRVISTSDNPPRFTYLLNFLYFSLWNCKSYPSLLPPNNLKVKDNQPTPIMTEKSSYNALIAVKRENVFWSRIRFWAIDLQSAPWPLRISL